MIGRWAGRRYRGARGGGGPRPFGAPLKGRGGGEGGGGAAPRPLGPPLKGRMQGEGHRGVFHDAAESCCFSERGCFCGSRGCDVTTLVGLVGRPARSGREKVVKAER